MKVHARVAAQTAPIEAGAVLCVPLETAWPTPTLLLAVSHKA
jgi:hypothetical protein